jgi:hypothetical protein
MSENALYMSEMTEILENNLKKGKVKKLETLLEPTLTHEAKLRVKPKMLEAKLEPTPRRWWMI